MAQVVSWSDTIRIYRSLGPKEALAIRLPLLWFCFWSHLPHVNKSGSTVWLLPLSNVHFSWKINYICSQRSVRHNSYSLAPGCRKHAIVWTAKEVLSTLPTSDILRMIGRWDQDWKHLLNVILHLLWRQLRLLYRIRRPLLLWLAPRLQFTIPTTTIFYFTIQLLH